MAKIADEMLDDLDKETVEFVPNFDESLKEPSVLPAKLPNLLINGSSGIAVGMATNIPPHNISEVIDGTVALIDNPAIEPLELLKFITGPDFPTGAYIYGREGIKEAYLTGRGTIKIRARAEIAEEGGRSVILVTEIPYIVNKAKLIENIADLVRDKRLEGISDLRDESDRDGMRIVIELKKGANASVLLNQLYKHTQMETTFGINNLALVDNQPRTLSLKETLEYYIRHRQDVVTRRSQFELKKARAREHVLAGLLVALDNIDDFVSILRKSPSADDAKAVFMSKYGLSEEQSKAILDMRLRGLTGLERKKIEDERVELLKLIGHLDEVLASPQMVLDIIKSELLELKAKYGDGRRTIIKESDGEIIDEDLIPVENVVVTISNTGYIKRQPVDTYRTQRRGGMGVMGMETKEEDFVVDVFAASTHDHLMFFTNKGRVLRAQGLRDTRGQQAVQGQGDREPAHAAAERVHHRHDPDQAVRRQPLSDDVHPRGHHQEDGAIGFPEHPEDGHHRHRAGRGRRADIGQDDQRQPGGPGRHEERQGEPLLRDGGPAHGPPGGRGHRHPAHGEGQGHRHGGRERRLDDPYGLRERLRQAYRHRRLRPDPPRHAGHHQHQDHHAQRRRRVRGFDNRTTTRCW